MAPAAWRCIFHRHISCPAATYLQRVIRVLTDSTAHPAAVVADHASNHTAVDGAGIWPQLILYWQLVLLGMGRQQSVHLTKNETRLNSDHAAITLGVGRNEIE